jgi:hypothetical protein
MNSKTGYGDNIMKTKLIILQSLIVILVLSACTGAPISSSRSSTQTVTNETNQLPTLPKLVVGTYKLIGSSTPITQTQAQQLVILWKAYKELQTRDSKAKKEVTDLLAQINSSLTTEQNAAIEAMNLSTRDVISMVQELGINSNTAINNGTGPSSSSSSSRSGTRSGGATGGFPGGPPQDFVFSAGPGQDGGFSRNSNTAATPSASMRATIQARRAESGAQTATMALLLIDPLITKLESIANQG